MKFPIRYVTILSFQAMCSVYFTLFFQKVHIIQLIRIYHYSNDDSRLDYYLFFFRNAQSRKKLVNLPNWYRDFTERSFIFWNFSSSILLSRFLIWRKKVKRGSLSDGLDRHE